MSSIARQVLIALVLAGVATMLLLRSQGPDQQRHNAGLGALAEMRIADARFGETLLRTHAGLLASYDPLVRVAERNVALLRRVGVLLDGHLNDDATMATALENARQRLHNRLEATEEFKTTHAVVRGSLLQLAPLARAVREHAAEAADAPWAKELAQRAEAVPRFTLSHHVNGGDLLFSPAYAAHRNLEIMLLELPETTARLVRPLLQHAMLILASRDELNDKLDAALQASVADATLALERAHLDAYALAAARSDVYGVVLYACVVLLLLQSGVLALRATRYTTRLHRREAALRALHEAASAEQGDAVVRAGHLVERLRETLSLSDISLDWGGEPAGSDRAALRLPVYCEGEVRGWLNASARTPLADADGDREFLALVARWLGSEFDRSATAAALRTETERARTTLDSIADAVLTTDADGVIDYANPAALRMTGRPPAMLIGRPAHEVLVLVREQGGEILPVQRCLRARATQSYDDELELERDNGNLLVKCTVSPLAGASRELDGCVVVLQDVQAHRDLSRELLWRASHDGITGLLNRAGFEAAVVSLLETTAGDDDAHVLVMLDVDQFYVINDLHGRAAGDNVLRAIADRLRAIAPEESLIARLDGDAFAVLLPNAASGAAHRMIESVRGALADERLASDDGYFEVTAAYGIAPSAGATLAGEWISAAESACNAARALGHDRVSTLRVGDEAIAQRRAEMQWVSRLNDALDDHRLVLYEQPVVSSADPGGEPSHWEVLLRLADTDGRIVPPGEFLPVAERYGLIGRVDRYVVALALERLKRTDLPARRYAINLSGLSLGDPNLVGYLHDLLDAHALPPGSVCFEITETAAVADLDNATRLIEALRALGCTFALDDFGAGLSSFNYLRRLPVDYLKIDGAFVRGIDEDRINRGMVEAIHRVGEVMGIQTIGEFVESERICTALAEIGVDFAQGYWTGKPSPVAWEPVAQPSVEKRA